MKKILLFRREHILDFMKANIRSYALTYCSVRNEIVSAPRNIYREVLRDLQEEVDLTGYEMSRTDEESLVRMATLFTLWEVMGTAELGEGYTLNIEEPQEMVEAAKLLIPIAERYMRGETAEGDLDKCAGSPPVRVSVLSADEIRDRLLEKRSEYDAEMTAVFAMASQDKESFIAYARKLEGKTGIKLTRGNGRDMFRVALYASRAAALSILSMEDTDTFRTSAESLDALDNGIKAFNAEAGKQEKPKSTTG